MMRALAHFREKRAIWLTHRPGIFTGLIPDMFIPPQPWHIVNTDHAPKGQAVPTPCERSTGSKVGYRAGNKLGVRFRGLNFDRQPRTEFTLSYKLPLESNFV